MTPSQHITNIIQNALSEDIGAGDITSNSIIPEDANLSGQFIAKADGVIAGLEVVKTTFALLDTQIDFSTNVNDGETVTTKQIIATIHGPGRTLLSGERVALNLLQRMSGIASLTQQFVQRIQGSNAKILDTRKTVPNLRELDKWAVRIGGGENHRFGLFDMVLIKDNHITASGSVTAAVNLVRAQNQAKQCAIEVEVSSLAQLEEAINLKVDRIMLDNMNVAQMRKAVILTNGRTPLEASGNINLENVFQVAATGVDYISVGELTHSVRALDISLLLN